MAGWRDTGNRGELLYERQLDTQERAAPTFVFIVLAAFLLASFARIELLISLKIGVIVLIVVSLGMLFRRTWTWTPIHTGMALFLVLSVSSILYANNYFAAYRISRMYLGFIIVAMGIAWLMSTPRLARKFIALWVLALGYVSAYAIFNGGKGPGGYVGDENDLALTAAMGLPYALFGLASSRRPIRLLCIVLAVVFVAASVSSFSRGGMIAMGSVGIFYYLKSAQRFKKFMLVVMACICIVSFAPEKYMSEFRSISGDLNANSSSSTGTIRLFMWATAFNVFKENPVFGEGAGNFPYVVGIYQPREGNWPESFFRRDRSQQSAHSFYFKLLAEHGLVGILVVGFLTRRFMSVLSEIAKKPDKDVSDDWGYLSPRLLANATIGSMIAFLTGGVFLSVLTYPHFFYLLGIGAGLGVACRVDHESPEAAEIDESVAPKLP